MGRGAAPQKKWPSFWLPTLTQEEWSASNFLRTTYDFLGMASVAFLRGALVFAPILLVAYLQGGALPIGGVVRATGVLTIGQPLAYLLGWYVPFSLGTSLEKIRFAGRNFSTAQFGLLAIAQL